MLPFGLAYTPFRHDTVAQTEIRPTRNAGLWAEIITSVPAAEYTKLFVPDAREDLGFVAATGFNVRDGPVSLRDEFTKLATKGAEEKQDEYKDFMKFAAACGPHLERSHLEYLQQLPSVG